LWYSNSVLDALDQQQKVNDEQWNGSIGRELLVVVSVSIIRGNWEEREELSLERREAMQGRNR